MIKNITLKIITLILIISLIGVVPIEARNYDSKAGTYYHNANIINFDILINGDSIKSTEHYKLEVNGRTYLAMRDIANILGVEIQWDNDTKSISMSDVSFTLNKYTENKYTDSQKYFDKTKIRVTEVNYPIYVNGIRKYPQYLQLVAEGRTYLSIRDISNMLGINIDWDNNTKSVLISKNYMETNESKKDINEVVNNSISNTVSVQKEEIDNEVEEMLKLVNEFREKNGKLPLQLITDKELQDYTAIRAIEIVELFSHKRPDGSGFGEYPPLTEMNKAWGENLHAGTPTAQTAMENWKISPGHMENMLDDDFTHMYYTHYHQENSKYKDYHVQLFVRPKN